MKKLILLISFVALLLAACSNDKASKDPSVSDNKTEDQPNSNNEPSNNSSQTSDYFGYKPENELEEKYFAYIKSMPNWSSYEYNLTYTEQKWRDEDIPFELYEHAKIIVSPFQMYKDYKSMYLRNTYFEQYVTENEAYENSEMDGWEPLEDPPTYDKNRLPMRAKLLFALIDAADELYEIDTNKVTFSVREREWEDLAYRIWLSYFHNVFDDEDAKAEGLDELYDALQEIEGFEVQLTSDGTTITEIEILISYNRYDVDMVDQLHYHETFNNINSLTEIEMPSEITEN